MRGPTPTPITLSPRQQALLERLTRRHTSPQALVRRAQIVLASATSANNSQIAHQLNLHRETVRIWRERWLSQAPGLAAAEGADDDDLQLTSQVQEVLADLPRPGAPDTFSAEQVVGIVALACTHPSDSGRPVEDWTPHDLADEAVKRELVPSISPRSVGRFLKSSTAQAPSKPLLAEHKGDRSDPLRHPG